MDAADIAAGRERWQTPLRRRPQAGRRLHHALRRRPSTRSTGRPPGRAYPGFERIGWPGEFPYTRGLYPTGYRGRTWTIRQFAGFGNAQQTNERYKMILGGRRRRAQRRVRHAHADGPRLRRPAGARRGRPLRRGDRLGRRHGRAVRRDPPAGRHHQHDHLRPGRAGLLHVPGGRRAAGRRPEPARRHAADRHLQGVHRAEGVALRPRAAPAPDRRPDGVLRRARSRSTSRSASPATTSGRPARPPRRSWRTRWPTASATSSSASPAAWTSTRSRPGLSFFFDAHVDFFEEIAKFRAARRIWARHLRDDYGATSEKALWLKFHTQTAGVSLTAQQPVNNVVRTAVEALAAVLGGTNSLHTNALDETLALPTDESAEIALRTQQVLMEETGVVNVADPLGGSWYVEAAHRPDRGRGRGDLHPDPRARPRRQHHRRHPARHRGRLVHRPHRRGRLRLPAGPGEGREADRRRQRAHRHRRQGPGDPAGLARGRAGAAARAGRARRADPRCGTGEGRARRAGRGRPHRRRT